MGVCVVSSVFCRLLGRYNREQAFMLSAVTCTMIIGFVLLRLTPVFSFIEELCSICSVSEKYMLILFKSAGICYITQFTCDICSDCGEKAVSTAAEIAGKAALMIISLPLLEEVVSIVQKYTS